MLRKESFAKQMIDKEKVKKALECCSGQSIRCGDCPYYPVNTDDADFVKCNDKLCADALALLKEQDAEIDEISDEYLDLGNEIAKMPKVVRCKDCKYGRIYGIHVECTAHEEIGYDPEPWHPLDWFCADGERRTDDA